MGCKEEERGNTRVLARGEEIDPTRWRGAGKGWATLQAMHARSHERGETKNR